MADKTESTTRIRYLLTSLVIILIFIFALLVVLVAYPVVFAPPPAIEPSSTLTLTSSSTIVQTPTITPTPEPSGTRRPTLTPTITLIPSQTPTPTLTPTFSGPPTLTPARPIRGKDYSLQEWSPQLADYMVRLMDDFPNTLSSDDRGENDQGYFAAFYYATIAQKEALLRYPDVPQTVFWQWGLAYNLALVGDPQAGELYAEIITQNLNQGDIDIEEIETWFEFQEDRLEFDITELSPIPGYLSSYLIEIKGGGSVFIVLMETNFGFHYYVLEDNFDFVNDPKYRFLVDDLTGYGIEELVIYPIKSPDDLTLHLPPVYSMEQIPPVELDINQATGNFLLGMEFSSQWSVEPDTNGDNQLIYKTRLFPPCLVVLSRTYQWNDQLFDLTDNQYQIIPYPDTLTFCSFIVDHAGTVWGPEAAIQIMEPILPDWPPNADENGDPYPLDAKDEWRYRLGIYHALIGNFEEATQYLNEVITFPIIPESRWIGPAQDFLSSYKSTEDIYKACLTSEFCDPRRALSFLVENLDPGDFSNALTYLSLAGVKTRASGEFDFEGDGENETWFTIRHHELQKLEFWILSPYSAGIEPIFVSVVESSSPTISLLEDESIPPVVLLDGSFIFSIHRVPGSSQPYLVYPDLPDTYPNRFEDGLQIEINALFAGANPASVKTNLLLLQENPGLLCEPYWSCDLYYYILGLASELSGDEKEAVNSYTYLWWNYSRSPFTTMARLKLEGAILPPFPTETPTPTLTPTTTITPAQFTLTATTGFTSTPSPGAIQTPTPVTPYPGPAQSPTPLTPYPGPAQSPTPVTPYP